LACDLRGAAGVKPTSGDVAGVRLCRLREELLRILNHPWVEPVFGVQLGRVLGGVNDVSFEALTEENLVELSGGTLRLNASQYREMAETIDDDEAFLRQAVLYFLHELVHERVQGIGRKMTVEALRMTGGEMTLLHLDLAADHAAAMLAHHST